MQLARLLLVAVCAFTALVSANAESHPLDSYKSIIDRNPFGLKDPPPPPVAPPTNAPKAEVKKEEFYLTGISTIGNAKHPKAYLLAKDANKKEYDQKFYNLTVGDRQGDLTLLDVDTKGRRVKVAYLGEEKWLSMKENGVPAPAGGAPVPGVPGMPGGVPGAMPVPLPTPGGVPTPPPAPVSYPNSNNRRTPRTAYSGGGYQGGANLAMGGMNATFGAPGNGSITANGTGAAGNVPNEIARGPQTDEDVARQIINMNAYAQHAANQGQVTPPIPKFP